VVVFPYREDELTIGAVLEAAPRTLTWRCPEDEEKWRR